MKIFPQGVGVVDLEKGRFDEKTDYPWLTDDSYAWNGWSWGGDLKLKTPDIIVDELVDIVSKNGCLLLNITPTHDGKISEEMRNGLLEVGKWLEENGEAVYETRPFVVYGEGVTQLEENHFGGVQGRGIEYTDEDFRFTTNGDVLYIVQLAPPVKGKTYMLKSFSQVGKAANIKLENLRLLKSDSTINWSKNNEGICFSVPDDAPDDKAVVYKAKFSIKE